MNRLRTKLLAVMLIVVAVTVGMSALFTRRITHEELRKLLVARLPNDVAPLERHYRTHGGWSGVDATIASMPARVILTTPDDRVIAVSSDLRGANVSAHPGQVVITAPGTHMIIHVPPQAVVVDGRAVANAYLLPDRAPIDSAPVSTLDRRLIVTFASATLVAILLALLLSQRITRPVERLTAAVAEMARGAHPSPVEVKGGDEIAQLARSFNAMVAAIADQEELRRRMVSDVAHELRTPLTNLRCELESIQDGLVPADTLRLASLHEEIAHLSRLVDDLQELAVGDAGGLQLNIETLDLAAVIRHVIEIAAPRNIDVQFDAGTVCVDGDRTRLTQIVRNLLTNALQHTPDGGTIRVCASSDAANAMVSIEDSGPGIPETELEKIFERFYRVDASRNRATGGAGLGLAIVKRLVELHGGRVWATSSASGAKFTFTIPLHQAFTPAG